MNKKYVIKKLNTENKLDLYVMWEKMIVLFNDENQAEEFIKTFDYFFIDKPYEIIEAPEVISSLHNIQYDTLINLKSYKDALEKLKNK